MSEAPASDRSQKADAGGKRNVTEAALEVGYESVSQFIRDYRKMFGAAPGEDMLNFKRKLKE